MNMPAKMIATFFLISCLNITLIVGMETTQEEKNVAVKAFWKGKEQRALALLYPRRHPQKQQEKILGKVINYKVAGKIRAIFDLERRNVTTILDDDTTCEQSFDTLEQLIYRNAEYTGDSREEFVDQGGNIIPFEGFNSCEVHEEVPLMHQRGYCCLACLLF